MPDYGKKGPGCNVGQEPIAAFNRTPNTVLRINSLAYAKQFGAPPANTAPVNTCTRCHYIGTQFTCDMGKDGHGSPPPGRSYWDDYEKVRTTTGNAFPNTHWMPPLDDWPESLREQVEPRAPGVSAEERARLLAAAKRGYENYFGPAIRALAYCCANPGATVQMNGQAVKICQSAFSQTRNLANPCAGPPVEARRPQGLGH